MKVFRYMGKEYLGNRSGKASDFHRRVRDAALRFGNKPLAKSAGEAMRRWEERESDSK